MWGGLHFHFAPGQKRVFTAEVARSIINDHQNLGGQLAIDTAAETAPAVEPAPEEDKWTERVNRKGQTEYRHNGRLVSKEQWAVHLA